MLLQWFLDLKEGTLYLIPPAGKKPAALLLEPVHQPTVFTVLGTCAQPCICTGVGNSSRSHSRSRSSQGSFRPHMSV